MNPPAKPTAPHGRLVDGTEITAPEWRRQIGQSPEELKLMLRNRGFDERPRYNGTLTR